MQCSRVDGLKHFAVNTADANVERRSYRTDDTCHILVDRGTIRHRDQRAETLRKFVIRNDRCSSPADDR